MPTRIVEVIREMVRTSDKPAKALARELGKPYSTFMRELSQADTGAKFGVDLLLPLMTAALSAPEAAEGPDERLCCIIPAYNAAATLPRLLEAVLPLVPDILVVDDGSADTTAAVARDFADRGVTVLVHPVNRGKAAALRTGFTRAVREGYGAAVTMPSPPAAARPSSACGGAARRKGREDASGGRGG